MMSIKAVNTGMIILGGGVVKHHICNANLMVSNNWNMNCIIIIIIIVYREMELIMLFILTLVKSLMVVMLELHLMKLCPGARLSTLPTLSRL